MSPLDALTGEHEEEDAGDEHGSAQLLPYQHGWTDDDQAAGALSSQSAVQPANGNMSGRCHLNPPLCSAGAPTSFISMEFVREPILSSCLCCVQIGGDGPVTAPGSVIKTS